MTVRITPASTRRFILLHRRVLAAAFAGLAVLFALGALKPTGDLARVVVARHDLAAGSLLAADDLRVVSLATATRPSHSWAGTAQLLGRRVAAPLRRGEPLTDFRLLEPGLLAGYGNGLVLSTIRLGEATGLTGLRVGDHVDVVGSTPQGPTSTVVAHRAEVASLPRSDNGEAALTLAVSKQAALQLATAAVHTRLSIVVVP